MNDNVPDRLGIGGNMPPPTAVILREKYEPILAGIEVVAELADDIPETLAGPDDDANVADLMRDLRRVRDELEQCRERENRPLIDQKRETDDFFGRHTGRVKTIMAILQKRGDAYKAALAEAKQREAEENARKAAEEAARQRRLAEEEAARNRPVAASLHADKAAEADIVADTAAVAAAASPGALTRTRSAQGSLSTAGNEWKFEIEDYSAVDLNQVRPFIPRAQVEKAIAAHVRLHRDGQPLKGVRIFSAVKAKYR